jgi:hypothetical protein
VDKWKRLYIEANWEMGWELDNKCRWVEVWYKMTNEDGLKNYRIN